MTENYGYDFENRLVSYSSVTASASYKYDPMGRRIEKDVDGTITKFLWDKDIMIAELDTSNNITKLYTYNPKNNESISMTEGADTYWYLNDHLMTPQKMVDTSGAVVWAAEYKAFGKSIIDPSSTFTNNLRFPGQYYDPESGLHYNRWRYYDPAIGRYSRTDPLSEIVQVTTLETPGEKFITSILYSDSGLPKPSIIFYNKYLTQIPFEYNYYLYVNNDPLMNYDYHGLLFCEKGERSHFNMDLFMYCINEHGGPLKPIMLTVACIYAIAAVPPTLAGFGAGLLAVTATCGTAAAIVMPCARSAIECLKPWPPCQH